MTSEVIKILNKISHVKDHSFVIGSRFEEWIVREAFVPDRKDPPFAVTRQFL